MAAKNPNGQRLKVLRESAGLTQSELGMRFGIDRSVLSLIESGYRDMSESQREKIEKYLTQLAHKRLGECSVTLATA